MRELRAGTSGDQGKGVQDSMTLADVDTDAVDSAADDDDDDDEDGDDAEADGSPTDSGDNGPFNEEVREYGVGADRSEIAA